MMTATGKLVCALAIIGSVSMGSTAPSFAHEDYVREAASPECETPKLVKTIQSRFKTQAKRVHHRADWEITSLTHVHQHRYLPQDVHTGRSIARRYCHATAHFNDGSNRKIWYLIEGGMGFAGFGQSYVGTRQFVRERLGNGPLINNVEFCIEGLDKWNVYNAHCRLLR
jgi:hypothetical protein